MQTEFGENFIEKLQPKDGGLPDFSVALALVMKSLDRFHPDAKDKYLVDDMLAEDPQLIAKIVESAFPQAKGDAGNGKRPKAAA